MFLKFLFDIRKLITEQSTLTWAKYLIKSLAEI